MSDDFMKLVKIADNNAKYLSERLEYELKEVCNTNDWHDDDFYVYIHLDDVCVEINKTLSCKEELTGYLKSNGFVLARTTVAYEEWEYNG